jgi:predicted phage terminase large subunit-like protein
VFDYRLPVKAAHRLKARKDEVVLVNISERFRPRALPVASRAESGNVKLVDGAWVKEWLDEATVFPHGAHDDQVDAVSGAVQMIGEHKRKILFA